MAVSPSPAPPPDFPIDSVDVASWQHSQGQAINWAQVRDAGIDFATIKATEGSLADSTEYTNPWFIVDMNGARAVGLPVAPYHFYLGRTPGTGAAQAEYFISVLRNAGYTGQRPLDLPPILDFEWDWKNSPCPPHATVADARTWLDTVEAAFGRQPIIYTNKLFIADCLGNSAELGNYPLQIAHYGNTPPTQLPAGWRDWLMWQWTAWSKVPGIPAEVPRTVFRGTGTELDILALRTPVPPVPVEPPVVPPPPGPLTGEGSPAGSVTGKNAVPGPSVPPRGVSRFSSSSPARGQ